MKRRKKNPENFLNCHHDAASLPIQMPDASVPSPFSTGLLQRSGTEHAHLHVSYNVVMDFIHVFNILE